MSELSEAFRAGDGVDLIRDSVRLVIQELIEGRSGRADRRRPLRADSGADEPFEWAGIPDDVRPVVGEVLDGSCSSPARFRLDGRAQLADPVLW